MPLDPGTTFAGYRIDRLIGRGGMGEVYLATQPVLDRQVALKLLIPELTADQHFRDRFLVESRLAASLDHPNVVTVYEAGEADGRLFLAMRHVAGSDLRGILDGGGRLEPDRAIRLLTGVAAALDAAHRLDLVHRDVKPGNILIREPGTPSEHAYLADFGLVKQMSSSVDFTRAGQFVGSVEYVAPEQIEGGAVDGRADVYSLGAVLFECLAGQPPFVRPSEVATLWAHVQSDPPRLSERRPDLASLDAVIAKGLAKDPAQRQQTAGALMGEAAAALDGAPAPVLPPGRSLVRSRTRTGIAGAAAASLVVLAGVLLLSNRPFGAGPSPSGSAAASEVAAGPSNEATNPAAVSPAPLAIGPLAAGPYVSTVFDPDIAFNLGAGWTLADELPQLIQLIDTTEPNRSFFVARFRDAIDHTDPQGRNRIEMDETPDGVAHFLREHPWIEDPTTFQVNYAAFRGIAVDFIANVPPSSDQGGCFDPCAPLFWITLEPDRSDRFAIVDGWHYRMSFVSTAEEVDPVLVFITETSSQADFDAFAPKALEATVTMRLAPQAAPPTSPPGPSLQPIAGAYTADLFVPPLTLTAGSGWGLAEDLGHVLWLRDTTGADRNLYVARFLDAIDPADPDSVIPLGIERKPATIVDWLVNHPQLVSGPRLALDLPGLDGFASEAVASVSFEEDVGGCSASCAPLFRLTGQRAPLDTFLILQDWHYRFAVVDAPIGEGVLVIVIEAPTAEEYDAFAPRATDVIRTIRFAEPG